MLDVDERLLTFSRPEGLDSYGPDETPILGGDDGDDNGEESEHGYGSPALFDMVQAGHGFLIKSTGLAPKLPRLQDCETCGAPIPLPGADDWVCELGSLPGSLDWDICGCNWCLHRRLWLQERYSPNGGRPAKRCGSADCKRIAAAERQRKRRTARKSGSVTETP